MTTKNVPQIKSITATKEGRFWALKIDGKLLAVVLYKAGAVAVQELLQKLAGLPSTVVTTAETKPRKPINPPKARAKAASAKKKPSKKVDQSVITDSPPLPAPALDSPALTSN